ncbi:MAG: hypothetical protein JXA71_08040 [Chitinispirillaceae bacterium]|nr:hypothetical protein [Chitinispirillaceae bacterium]
MSVSNVGNVDSWMQFVKLVQEARSRSAGYDGAVTRSSFVKKGASLLPASQVRQQYGIMKSAPPGAAQNMTGARMKVAGTFFDAYA